MDRENKLRLSALAFSLWLLSTTGYFAFGLELTTNLLLAKPTDNAINWGDAFRTGMDNLEASICDKRDGKTCTIFADWTFSEVVVISSAITLSSATLNYQTIFKTQDITKISTFTADGKLQIQGDFTVGTSSFVVLASSIGIRTATPVAALDVRGPSQFGNAGSQSTFTAAGVLQLQGITNGSVLFSTTSGVGQDNTNLFWDDENNRLRVGAETSANPLTVSGSIRLQNTSSDGRTISNAGGGNNIVLDNLQLEFYDPTEAVVENINTSGTLAYSAGSVSGYHTWRKGSTELMRLFNTGELSLGNPVSVSGVSTLTVVGSAAFGNIPTRSTFTSAGNFQSVANSTWTSNGTLSISTAASAALTGLPALFINSSGNVGISSQVPNVALEVGGEIQASTITISNRYVQGGNEGQTLGACSSSQYISSMKVDGGIVTGVGSCTAAGAGDASLASTQTFTGANTFTSSVTVGPTAFASAETSSLSRYLNGWTLVASTAPTGATGSTITSITADGFYWLMIRIRTGGTTKVLMTFNSDRSANTYGWENMEIVNGASAVSRADLRTDTAMTLTSNDTLDTGVDGILSADIFFDANQSDKTIVRSRGDIAYVRSTLGDLTRQVFAGHYDGTSNLNAVGVIPTASAGTITGDIILYKSVPAMGRNPN